MLRGRDAEQAAIDRLLTGARDGTSGAVVVRGEPGIGKTALLAYALEHAAGMTVLQVTGTEAESALPFAGLHLLLRDAVDDAGDLPDPQRHAIDRAFGRRSTDQDQDDGTSRLLVGFAALSMIAQLAESAPVLCLIDDAQWLDLETTEALLFVARRLGSEGVAMLFAARAPGPDATDGLLAGLPELVLDRLDTSAAAALLDERFGDLSPQARFRVLADSAGNPLALLELPTMQATAMQTTAMQTTAVHSTGMHATGMQTAALHATGMHAAALQTTAVHSTAMQTTGMRSMTEAESQPLTQRLRSAFAGQTRDLPPSTRALLRVAAADGTGDLATVLPAAGRLGAGLDDLARAERTGVIRITGDRLRFRHPLIRTAVLEGSDFVSRRAAHQALADTLTAPEYADRRAHHLAETVMGPDDEVAAELERTAERAGARYGHAGVATAYERSARLSSTAALRARRFTLAAEAAMEAGQIDRAGALAEMAGSVDNPALVNTATVNPATGDRAMVNAAMVSAAIDDPGLAATLDHVRAEVHVISGAPRAAHRLLIDGAAKVADVEPGRAVAMLSDAAHMCWHIGDADLAALTYDRLAALRLPDGHPARHLVNVVAWLMAVASGRLSPSADGLQDALAAARDNTHVAPTLQLLVAGASMVAGQDAENRDLSAALLATARNRGQLNVVVPALTYLAQGQLFSGQHRAAAINVAEARDLAYDSGQIQWLTLIDGVLAYVAAIDGDEAACRRHADASATNALAHLQTAHASWAQWALSVYDLGVGRPESALIRLEELSASAVSYQIASVRSAPDQIEAAMRIGRPDRAAEPLRRLDAWATAYAGHRYAAVPRRCRAIMAPDAEAEAHFLAALRLHGPEGRPFEQARTELLYGEWLRRVRRNGDARIRLDHALATFERLGAAPWADRARAEIHASGGPAPDRVTPDALSALTPQESRIVLLAAAGQSNKEIAAQLFLSPRTVGYHLYKAYPKLGVVSRAELADLPLSPA